MTVDICLTFIIQAIVLIASIILLIKIPPMNSLYGYRTKKSSSDEESWKFANTTASIAMITISSTSMLIGCILLILKYCLHLDVNFMWFAACSLGAILLLPILITEILLSKRSGK